MAMKVGIQLYSVRDEMAKDPINAIRTVAGLGYKNLEFASSKADTERIDRVPPRVPTVFSASLCFSAESKTASTSPL